MHHPPLVDRPRPDTLLALEVWARLWSAVEETVAAVECVLRAHLGAVTLETERCRLTPSAASGEIRVGGTRVVIELPLGASDAAGPLEVRVKWVRETSIVRAETAMLVDPRAGTWVAPPVGLGPSP